MIAGAGRLSVEALDVVADGAWVAREISLDVGQGAIVAVLGGPGAGKSALLDAIAGLRHPSRGAVFLGEWNLRGLDVPARLALGIARSAQRPALFDGLDIRQHLRLGHLAQRSAAAIARGRVMRIIPELAGRERERVDPWDRGAARLLDIGRALMSAPTLLLLDEPSLDLGVERVDELLTALQDEGIGVLLAERYPRPALDRAGAACLMVSGRIVAAGPPSAIGADERLLPACAGELSL